MKEKVFGKIFFEVDFWGGDVLDIKIAVISNSLFKIDTATKKKKKRFAIWKGQVSQTKLGGVFFRQLNLVPTGWLLLPGAVT